MTLTVASVIEATGARVLCLSRSGVRTMAEAQDSDDLYALYGERSSSETLQGLTVSDLRSEMQDVTTDSRSTPARGLFVALSGERVDGHAFVGAAFAAGARGCIVRAGLDVQTLLGEYERATDSVNMSPADTQYLFLVPDCLEALQRLAFHWREKRSAEIIGVTGSLGKTTTKEIVAGVLSSRWNVLKTIGNRNTEIGLPLTLLNLTSEHRVAVLEMGMYAVGDISVLARIARPRIGIVTNVAPIHLERLGTIERIARAKSELVAALPRDGVAILNGDDPWTRAMAQTSGIARTILVGAGPECDYQAIDVRARGLDGVSFTLSAERRHIPFEARVAGTHLVPAFLSAIVIARELGMDWSDIQSAVTSVTLDVRQHIIRGLKGMLLIDDSYNAAPQSMSAALELLRAAPGVRVAVLGDMLELGPNEEAAHRAVGVQAAEVVDWLIVRGDRAAWMADSAANAGLSTDRIVWSDDNDRAAEAVLRIVTSHADSPAATKGRGTGRHTISSDDLTPDLQMPATAGRPDAHIEWSILVKGSRGMEMEKIVQRLRGHW